MIQRQLQKNMIDEYVEKNLFLQKKGRKLLMM